MRLVTVCLVCLKLHTFVASLLLLVLGHNNSVARICAHCSPMTPLLSLPNVQLSDTADHLQHDPPPPAVVVVYD